MFGFLNINKPKGITSFDVIYKLRKILSIKKIGHTGTLDPLATGVLPIAIGGATKLIEYLEDDKKYVATVKFGEISTTYDDEGEKTVVNPPLFSKEELLLALKSFEGKILQMPPIYSAIKVGGKKLYELARNGSEMPEITPREVEIYEIKFLNFISPDVIKIEVFCSKGTYIRSLANDLGAKLATGAYLLGLERIQAGKFKIENSINLNDINLKTSLVNPLNALPFRVYSLNEEEFFKVKNGNSISVCEGFKECEKILLEYENNLISISTFNNSILKVDKVFNLC